MNAETRTVVRAALDGSSYVAGARQVEQANQRMAASGETAAKAAERVQRAEVGAAQASGAAAGAGDRYIESVKRRTTAIERLEATLDRTIKAQRDFDRAQTHINSAVDRGHRTREEGDRLIALARQRYFGTPEPAAAPAASNRLTRQQMQALSPQLTDAAVQLAGGANPLLVAIQQGPQAADAVGGVGRAFTLLRGAVTPATAAMAAFVAVTTGSAIVAERQGRAMAELSNRLRATRNDYVSLTKSVEDAARAAAGRSPLSTPDARAAGRTIASSRNFAGTTAELEDLIRVSERLGQVMGTDAAEAAGRLAQALDRPAAAARRMQEEGLRTMDEGLLRTIQRMENQGRVAEAARLTLDAYRRAAAETAKTPLQRALEGLSQSFTRLWQAMKPAVDAIGGAMVTGLSLGVRYVTRLAEGLGVIARFLTDNRLTRLLFGEGAPAAPAATGQRSATETAMERVGQMNSRLRQREDNRDQAAALRAGLDGATPEQAREINDALRELQAGYEGLQDPVSVYLRGLQEQVQQSRTAEGAARELAAAQQAVRDAARSDGRTASPGEVAEARRLTQARLTEELTNHRVELDKATEAAELEARAMMEGERVAAQVRIGLEAERQARRFAVEGTEEYRQAVTLLTLSLEAQAEAQEKLRNTSATRDQERQLEWLRTEADLVGRSRRERAEELAVLRERQRIQSEGGDLNSEGAAQRLRNARTIAQLDQDAQEAAEMAQALGDAFTTAFEDAVQGGAKLSDVLRNLERDLLRIGNQKLIAEPLMNWFSGMLGGKGGSGGWINNLFGGGGGGGGMASLFSGAGGWLSSLFGGGGGGIEAATASAGGFLFRDGGIMTSAGPVPLRAYANGGIANSPQIALFGEGRQPEAYVPLPDGRRIPVAMQGGESRRAQRPINVAFNFPNADVNSFRQSAGQARASARRILAHAGRDT